LWIGASTHPGEEDVLLLAFRRLRAAVPNLLLLLAPRHPQRFAAVEAMLVKGGYRYLKRSQATQEHSHDVEVFLLDTLGELSSFYCCACITFVGGSLVKGPGGHSVIEPALARVPICVGPYTRNFATVVEELVRTGGGFVVHNEDELYHRVLPLLTNPHQCQEAGHQAYEVIRQGQGAVQRTMAAVVRYLKVSNQQSAVSQKKERINHRVSESVKKMAQ
jgi:3-deoxy-D-manno-octulosonic-acid transferase